VKGIDMRILKLRRGGLAVLIVDGVAAAGGAPYQQRLDEYLMAAERTSQGRG
jgi:hypothetical protein